MTSNCSPTSISSGNDSEDHRALTPLNIINNSFKLISINHRNCIPPNGVVRAKQPDKIKYAVSFAANETEGPHLVLTQAVNNIDKSDIIEALNGLHKGNYSEKLESLHKQDDEQADKQADNQVDNQVAIMSNDSLVLIVIVIVLLQ